MEILSQLQLLAAVNRAVHDEHYGQMRTKHLHSEIVYALAATQNVNPPQHFSSNGLDRRSVQNLWSQRFYKEYRRCQGIRYGSNRGTRVMNFSS